MTCHGSRLRETDCQGSVRVSRPGENADSTPTEHLPKTAPELMVERLRVPLLQARLMTCQAGVKYTEADSQFDNADGNSTTYFIPLTKWRPLIADVMCYN